MNKYQRRASFGKAGEELAAKEYKKRGYKIIGRNIKILGYKQLGEIDVIAKKKKELVFIEVKSRNSSGFMNPEESVNASKKNKLRKAVKAYIVQNPKYENYALRIDVCIVKPDIDNIPIIDTIISDAIQDVA